MSKKVFRARLEAQPRYPTLSQVSGRSLRDWGLVAVGTLMLGGCQRPSAPPPAPEMRPEGLVPTTRIEQVDASPVAAPAPDEPARVMPPDRERRIQGGMSATWADHTRHKPVRRKASKDK